MYLSVTEAVSKAWEQREALGINQSQEEAPIFEQPLPSTDDIDVSNTNLTEVEAEIASLEEQIAARKALKEENDAKIKAKQQEISDLQQEISDKIDEAVDAADEYTKEQQAAIKKATEDSIKEYIESNGSMTEDEMKANIAAKIGGISTEVPPSIVAMLSEASGLIDQLLAATNELSRLNQLDIIYSRDIKQLTNCLDNCNLKKEKLKKQEEEKRKCDPIGFVRDGDIYDLIIDRNNDGKFNNETEFLGAESGWNEMISLDQNGNNDGVVSTDEMERAGVKVIVTHADGTQEIKSISEIGLESIDLSSYKSSNESMTNGGTILGSFGFTFFGQDYTSGYNTLDTIDWLDANYSNLFTDKQEKVGRFNTPTGMPESQGNTLNMGTAMNMVLTLQNRLKQATTSINTTFELLGESKRIALTGVVPPSLDEEDETQETEDTPPVNETPAEDPNKKPEEEPAVV